jgi:hypothetical protein
MIKVYLKFVTEYASVIIARNIIDLKFKDNSVIPHFLMKRIPATKVN